MVISFMCQEASREVRFLFSCIGEKFDISKYPRARGKAVVLRKLTDMEDKQTIQYKGIARAIECKEDADKGILHIKAYALAFDNVDSYGDVIAPTACDEFLKSENASRIKLCYQHDRNEVIGVITDKGTDAIGMWIEADILPTTTGKDVQTLLKAGAINEFSIGYWADEYHYEKREGYQYDVRVLDAITVIEVSPVTRAANPKAVITDMKKEQENKPLNTEKMEDIKKQLDTLEQKAANAEQKAVAAEQKAAEKEQELKTAQDNINNLDASVKAQEKQIADLRKMLTEQPKSFEKAMRDALTEHKDAITNHLRKSEGSMKVQLKLATTDITAQAGMRVFGNQVDSTIHAVPFLSNAFILVFGTKPLTASRLVWREATTTQKAVGYVAELAENNNKTAIKFVEKFRQPAKIATYMELSSEADQWFDELVNFCTNEGQRIIMDDVDTKIWAGEGNDTDKQTEVYGIKAAATAFNALAKYENPTVADVILDAVAQVRKAGYAANAAIVPYATEQEIRSIKDKNGRYMYNEVTGMLGQVRIVASDKLGATEMLIADSSCAEPFVGSTYELEMTRKAETDSWRVDFRRLAQVKTPAPKKAGLIYVADKEAAIVAITKA